VDGDAHGLAQTREDEFFERPVGAEVEPCLEEFAGLSFVETDEAEGLFGIHAKWDIEALVGVGV
jgi:hypothetical protein